MNERELWRRALAAIPGGVNSPVRAFGAVGGEPFFAVSARGDRLRTAGGRELVDYVCSWGPLILGHAHPVVLAAVEEALRKGTTFGMPSPGEVALAELVQGAFPSVERLRMTGTGTEAAMAAVRLARAFTRRETVVKFSGCYHGHADGMLVEAGSGAETFSVPSSAGVPPSFARATVSLPYNDAGAAGALLRERGGEIACVIVEPVAGNMGVVPPLPGFLEALRDRTRECGALLVLDEVITGFRVAYGGAQERFGVAADLTVLGKILGGGLPLGAFGGRAEIMDLLAPAGPVYQAGTLSGNPLATAAGIATLSILSTRRLYPVLEEKGRRLAAGLGEACREAGVPHAVQREGSMLTLFFGEGPITDLESARAADRGRFARFFRGMLERGVLLPPSPFEAWFLSAAHGDRDIDRTIDAARESLRGL
ncbi:MAG: glutamate-1-semialdehyde 2,1-aminomutase [bacterium]|nr:glutamate-1-semialdehyde 2,1-aminomutase [bacterium]